MDNGAILTSIIGASVATISLAIGKDSKVSEFRQQWIDALREDIAKLCSVSIALYRANVKYSLRDRMPELEQKNSDELVEEANNLLFRVRLRLDPQKPLSTELLDAMGDFVSLCTYAQKTSDETDKGALLVLGKAQEVLEEAWIRVRQGEQRFRWTFRFALTTLIGSLGILAFHWYQNWHKL